LKINKPWWVTSIIIAGVLILSVILLAIKVGIYKERPQYLRTKRVGVLLANVSRTSKLEGLKLGLAELGYVEGRDITYLIKNAEGSWEQVYSLALELAAQRPDVLVAGGRLEAQALAEAIQNKPVPVVFMGAASVKGGFRPSYMTGVDNFHTELAVKRLEFMVRLLPFVRCVLVLVDPRVAPGIQSLPSLKQAASQLGVSLQVASVSSIQELKKFLSVLKPRQAEGMLLTSSFLLEEGEAIELIGRTGKSLGWPIMGVNVADAEAGLLSAYGCPFMDQGRQAARLVNKILEGQDPATIPIETPDRLELVVNLDTARTLGLKVDPEDLKFVDRIIVGNEGGGVGYGKP